jgi:hypothetical protein
MKRFTTAAMLQLFLLLQQQDALASPPATAPTTAAGGWHGFLIRDENATAFDKSCVKYYQDKGNTTKVSTVGIEADLRALLPHYRCNSTFDSQAWQDVIYGSICQRLNVNTCMKNSPTVKPSDVEKLCGDIYNYTHIDNCTVPVAAPSASPASAPAPVDYNLLRNRTSAPSNTPLSPTVSTPQPTDIPTKTATAGPSAAPISTSPTGTPATAGGIFPTIGLGGFRTTGIPIEKSGNCSWKKPCKKYLGWWIGIAIGLTSCVCIVLVAGLRKRHRRVQSSGKTKKGNQRGDDLEANKNTGTDLTDDGDIEASSSTKSPRVASVVEQRPQRKLTLRKMDLVPHDLDTIDECPSCLENSASCVHASIITENGDAADDDDDDATPKVTNIEGEDNSPKHQLASMRSLDDMCLPTVPEEGGDFVVVVGRGGTAKGDDDDVSRLGEDSATFSATSSTALDSSPPPGSTATAGR